MSTLPFTKLEMPMMTSDVVVGFNTLLLPVLQNNTLARGAWCAIRSIQNGGSGDKEPRTSVGHHNLRAAR
jgi:hypothetical protein